MLERSAEIDDLAARIFLAEHFCSRDIQAPEPSEPVAEVHTWMELNDFDQAPLAGSNGDWFILRSELADQPAQPIRRRAAFRFHTHVIFTRWRVQSNKAASAMIITKNTTTTAEA